MLAGSAIVGGASWSASAALAAIPPASACDEAAGPATTPCTPGSAAGAILITRLADLPISAVPPCRSIRTRIPRRSRPRRKPTPIHDIVGAPTQIQPIRRRATPQRRGILYIYFYVLDAEAADIDAGNSHEPIGIRRGIDRRPKNNRRKEVGLEPPLIGVKAPFYFQVVVERQGLREGINTVSEVEAADSRSKEVGDSVVELGGVITGARAWTGATIRRDKDDITLLSPE